jgi:hypothetical protein
MQEYLKKILFPILIISTLSFILFLGPNYAQGKTPFLGSVITAWVTVDPLEVKVYAPKKVKINRTFSIRAKIINRGKEKIENAKAEIHLTSGLVLLRKDAVQEIGVIPGNRQKMVFWTVGTVEGTVVGNHVIVVSASGTMKGDSISAENTVKVEVQEKIRPRWPRGSDFFKEFFDFFREWFNRRN